MAVAVVVHLGGLMGSIGQAAQVEEGELQTLVVLDRQVLLVLVDQD